MKLTLNEISALQINEVIGPFTVTKAEMNTARVSMSNYKNLWPGADFFTKSEPLSIDQPDGTKREIPGWFQFSFMRTSYGNNPKTGEKEGVRY